MKTLIALAALPALALSAPAAMANGTNTAQVSLEGIDLASEQGAAEMKKRIRQAAYKVCMFDEDGMLNQVEVQNSCARTAMKTSEGQMATLIANARYGG